MHSKKKISKGFYIGIGVFVLVFFVYTIGFIWQARYRTPYCMVIINPAHGGKYSPASDKDGDLYDPVNKRYTQDIQEGYTAGGISEYQILSDLSKKIYKRLSATKSVFKWKKFKKLLLKYGSKGEYKKVILDPEIIKKYDHKYYSSRGKKDINRYFRLFDYPFKSIFKRWEKGILSTIKKMKPEIVLNIDFNYSGKGDKELFSVIVPDIGFFNYIRGKIINRDKNFKKYQKVIDQWYGRSRQEKIRNLITDTWIYFTGSCPDKSLFAPSDKFIGLGYNSIRWKYKDKKYPHSYKNKKENPQYSSDLKDFKLNGPFWKREQNDLEKYKRLLGDYRTGDNEYISEEMLKYIISVLKLNKDKNTAGLKKILPVYKYDAASLFVNSLTININLGSFLDEHIRNIYKHRLDRIADAVCICLYSIIAGYDLKAADIDPRIKPNGKPIDFKKYYKHHYMGQKRMSYY